MIAKENLLKTKQHFEILDGLRGIAAIAVVVFHFMEIAITDYSKNFIGHGYLAVDFFFCLSGFVIVYAYDNRLGQIGAWQFIKLRLIRLQPLVIIGSILGLLTFIFDPFSDFYASYGFGKTALIFLSSILLIPYPAMSERYLNLFSLNAPAWSLFWEYVINIVYALALFKAPIRVLQILTLLGAVILFYVAINSKNIAGGWGGPNFWDGGARVLFSFLFGMLIYRSNCIIKNKIGFLGLCIFLIIGFLIPYNDEYNWLVEPMLVMIYFPLIVSLGAGSSLKPSVKKLAKLSGEISYPLYMTHYPFVWIFLTYVAVVKPSLSTLAFVIPISVISLIILAYLILIFIDAPMRNYLKNRLTKAS
ncbi:MAG: acyltransferase [Flavobacterium sp.]|nr:MAG: acyltransferase [Flavobacterium sp.]